MEKIHKNITTMLKIKKYEEKWLKIKNIFLQNSKIWKIP